MTTPASVFAAIDLGGTNINAAIADQHGTVVAQESVSTDSHLGPPAVLKRMAELVERLVGNVAGERRLAGAGIGVPGLVDLQTGTTKFLPNLPTQWRDVAVAATLGERLGAPVRLLNDCRTATLGEMRFGHGKDQPQLTMAFFSIGTGVGGGIVIDGKLRLGPLGAAGEIGHQTILPDGPRCGCGNRGCLEAIASGSAIAAEGLRLLRSGLAPALYKIVDGDGAKVNARTMAQAANDDPLVREAFVTAGKYIGIAAANLVTTLHPELIVLGGGVAESGDVLLDSVKEEIKQRVGMLPTTDLQVELSLLGDQAGVMGAVALAMDIVSTES